MKTLLNIFLAILLLVSCQTKKSPDSGQDAKLAFHQWATTPPMGWNSWAGLGVQGCYPDGDMLPLGESSGSLRTLFRGQLTGMAPDFTGYIRL
jgi:hypothetical protein